METKLIIWDEAYDEQVMSVNNEDNVEKLFGRKVVVLEGGFRQTLSGVKRDQDFIF